MTTEVDRLDDAALVQALDAKLREAERSLAQASRVSRSPKSKAAIAKTLGGLSDAASKEVGMAAVSIGATFAGTAQASPEVEATVYEMDACMREADERIAAVQPHQYVAVPDSSMWRARGKAYAAAWKTPDGRHITLLHMPRLDQLLDQPDGRDRLQAVLTHEYAHHVTGRADGDRKLAQRGARPRIVGKPKFFGGA